MKHPGIRSGKLPPIDAIALRERPPALGLRVRPQGWACAVSVNGHWLPAKHVTLDVDARGEPELVVRIPCYDLVIETESERAGYADPQAAA